MESITDQLVARHRVHFPDTRTLIIEQLRQFCTDEFITGFTHSELIDYCFKKIELVRDICTSYQQSKIAHIFSNGTISTEMTAKTIDIIKTKLRSSWNAPNEFFTVFDMALGSEVHIDERVKTLLGLNFDQFHSSTNDAIHPEKTLYFSDDLYPSMRYAMICYMIMCMPGFNWQSHRDHYLVRLRLSTRNSKLDSVRQMPYITVDKRCYFVFENKGANLKIPQYHLDRYTVYPDMELDHVFHTLVSDDKQSPIMNVFSYLFNLYLIGIAPKYVLMLDERQTHDRNKQVAKSMEAKIKHITGRIIEIDEHKIADCFAKTIRHRIEDAFNEWDHRKNGNRIRITSDAESVMYARKLGILPIPSRARELVYSLIME